MLPSLIVTDKERGEPFYRLSGRLIILPRDLLIVNGPPQPFDKDVVECPSPPIHAHLDPCCCQTASEVVPGKLRSLIGVENVRSSDSQRLVERLETKAHVHGARHCPRQDRATAPIPHGDQGDQPTMEPTIRDVRTPDVVHPCAGHPPEHVRVDSMRRMPLTQVWCGIDRLDPHRMQPPRHPFVMHGVALAP